MQQDHSAQAGTRVALIDGDVVRLGTIAAVVLREPVTSVRITWDDGYEGAATWTFPSADLKPVA